MDHERAGELLLPYLNGELGADDARRLEDHLSACDDCSLELRGLRALRAVGDPGLTDIERAMLHRAVRADLGVPAARSQAPRSSVRWLPASLAVAATLLVVALGIQFIGGARDLSDIAGEGASSEGSSGPAPVTLSFASMMEPDDEAVEDAELQESTASGSSDSAPQADTPSPEPAADTTSNEPLGKASGPAEEDLARYARSSDVFLSFARTYEVADVDELQDDFITQLAEQAPPAAADQLTECARLVIESRDFPTLPVAAAHGSFRAEESLLLGFVWTPEPSGPLDNYVLYVWPLGDCQTPTHSQIGRIRTSDR